MSENAVKANHAAIARGALPACQATTASKGVVAFNRSSATAPPP